MILTVSPVSVGQNMIQMVGISIANFVTNNIYPILLCTYIINKNIQMKKENKKFKLLFLAGAGGGPRRTRVSRSQIPRQRTFLELRKGWADLLIPWLVLRLRISRSFILINLIKIIPYIYTLFYSY